MICIIYCIPIKYGFTLKPNHGVQFRGSIRAMKLYRHYLLALYITQFCSFILRLKILWRISKDAHGRDALGPSRALKKFQISTYGLDFKFLFKNLSR